MVLDGVDDSPLRACNDWDKAEEILSMMKSRAIKPNEVTYTELIGICGRSGDVHQALVRKADPARSAILPFRRCCITLAVLKCWYHPNPAKERRCTVLPRKDPHTAYCRSPFDFLDVSPGDVCLTIFMYSSGWQIVW